MRAVGRPGPGLWGLWGALAVGHWGGQGWGNAWGADSGQKRGWSIFLVKCRGLSALVASTAPELESRMQALHKGTQIWPGDPCGQRQAEVMGQVQNGEQEERIKPGCGQRGLGLSPEQIH